MTSLTISTSNELTLYLYGSRKLHNFRLLQLLENSLELRRTPLIS